MSIKIIAHRGDSEYYPENTMSSFNSAFEKKADAIELDVHFSTDNKLLVHHDYYLGRTNNGLGVIYEKDSSYLKTLDAGSWFSSDFKYERIPFLEEIFDEFGNKILYEIEIKGFTADFLKALLLKVREFDLLNNIEFTSGPNYLISTLKAMEPNAKTGIFLAPFPNWMKNELGEKIIIENMHLGNINVAHCPLEILRPEFIHNLHKHNFLVHAANCDTIEDINKTKSLGIDQLSTNKLDLAKSQI